MLFPGKCGNYVGYLCYADCTCVNCEPHNWTGVGVVLGGKRYFRVMDLRPDNPLLDRLVTLHFGDGPSTREPMRLHPEMLVAVDEYPQRFIVVIDDAKIKSDASRAPDTQTGNATSSPGPVPDPKVP